MFRSGIVKSMAVAVCVVLAIGCGGSEEKKTSLSDLKKSSSSKNKSKSKSTKSSKSSKKMTEDNSRKKSGKPTGKIELSDVKKSKYTYTLVLNGVLKINDVRLEDGKYGAWLKMPAEKSKKDDKYWDFVRMSRDDKDFLAEQVSEEETSEELDGFEITNTTASYINRKDKMLAFIKFELDDGAINLSGWKLLKGKKGAWL
ncbi:MAG: hypothetical protein JKX97_04280, partial [Candidatus Lindowbacteria bacterium]|nr:hypothetical protein [Candidatus Lindowbacteria bacterium]